MAETVFGLGIFAAAALVMIGIGAVQRRSRTPVGFYSGEEPPQTEELTDPAAWNRRHGNMWIGYGVVILLSYLAGIAADGLWSVVLACGGVVLPLGVMIWYHHRLCERYLRKK